MKNYDVALRFVQGWVALKGNNTFIEGNVIYSYGHHFPMAVRLTDNSNLFDGGYKFILNEKKYSVSTSKHQSYLFGAINGNDIFFSTNKIQEFVDKKDISELSDINAIIKRNLMVVEKNHFEAGNLLKHKETGIIIEIEHIHKLYGWVEWKKIKQRECHLVVGSFEGLKQDWSNIGEFELARKEMIVRAL